MMNTLLKGWTNSNRSNQNGFGKFSVHALAYGVQGDLIFCCASSWQWFNLHN